MTILPLAAAILLAAAGMLAASETALFSLLRMERARQQLAGTVAAAVEWLLHRPLESLVVIIGLTEICNVFAECLATSYLLFIAGRSGAYWAVPLNFALIVLVADVTPKTFAQSFPGTVMKLTARPLAALGALLQPVTRYLPIAARTPEPVSESEFKALLQAGEREGQVEAAEREMIHKVFDLGGRRVVEIMTPREKIFSLPLDTPPAQLASEVARGHFSRVPIYQGSPGHVVGILHAKDLAARRLERTLPRLERLIRPPYFIPPSKPLGDLLEDMRRNRVQLALVVDEYGQLLGLATLEDLLEELFGELGDEFDHEVPEVTRLPDGGWQIAGAIELNKLAEVLGEPRLAAAASGAPTLNRYILRRLGRVPQPGERMPLADFTATIEEVTGASVELVTLNRGRL